ncbi:MAG: hypothetical protein IJA10_12460 [Lachnospiraceae bacterium]|nr:hypothetical protein [Lachnospiraceae bacterium]
MKKKTLAFSALILVVIMSVIIIGANCAGKDTGLKTLNPVIDVGDKIYVQHDSENKDVYDLQKSGTGTTTVYEVILPNFTADKAWTNKGEFVDNWLPHPVRPEELTPLGATAPEDYIPVKAGEEYFIRAYGVGYTGQDEDGSWWPWYSTVLFLNDNDEVMGEALSNTISASKKGVTVTVPEGATKMHLTMYNNQGFSLQKVLYLSDKEFDSLPINRAELEAEIDKKYAAYVQDKTVYQKSDKAYITFVNDDTWGSIDEFSEMFLEKDIPLVLATIPEALIENASSQEETRLEVARRVEAAGGEIIAHNGGVLTQEGFSDYNTMYSFFVRTKQMFNYYGFDVNGIILAGGQGQVTGAAEAERWSSSIYSYSDLYGVEYDKKGVIIDSVYYHYRTGLGNFKSDYDKIISRIDEAIENQQWLVFYFHSYSEIDKDVLAKVLDYVNSKSETELEVVTYKEMYEKTAVKESEVTGKKTTYYVSSTGTSKTGTSANDPMSYETANNKEYVSGDTILFKKGDTFYGEFKPKVTQVDSKITKVSSYGSGEMPVISAYKIADSSNSWQLYREGIYKIKLTDTSYFSGLTTTDANSTNIGFLEDKNGVKYYNKKSSLGELGNEYDFYCDGTYLYFKCGTNPYSKLGELKLATKTNLFILTSNMKVENIKLSGTGAHGFLNSEESVANVEISNNVIEDIGGSYLKGTTRYGNGIEFYGTNVSNLVVHDNIIRNVYDVGFTIQGTAGSGKNVTVKNNVFVQNSHDSEIWESGSATGVKGYVFTNNISINVGRGWGHDAREDKYDVAHILFWGYNIEDTDIYFHHNTVYNPRRLYFIEQTNHTDVFFKEKNVIRSDYNTYLLAEDSLIYRHMYKIGEKDTFISEFNKDANSTFTLIEVDNNIVSLAANTDSISAIRKYFPSEEEPKKEEETTTEESGSTEESKISSEEVVSTEEGKISSEEVVSTEEGEISSEETVSTEEGEISSEETVSTEEGEISSEETVSTGEGEISSEEVVSIGESEVSSEEPISTEEVVITTEEVVSTTETVITTEKVITTETSTTVKEPVKVTNSPATETVNYETESMIQTDKATMKADAYQTTQENEADALIETILKENNIVENDMEESIIEMNAMMDENAKESMEESLDETLLESNVFTEEVNKTQNHIATEQKKEKEETTFLNLMIPILNIKVKTALAATAATVTLGAGGAGLFLRFRKRFW